MKYWFLLLPLTLMATDWAPWTEKDLELHPRIGVELQSNSAFFTELGLEGSYDVWQVDLELNLAKTHKNAFNFNDIRLMGRYRWFNDIVGDFATLQTGFTLIQACHRSLNDKDLFHHGTTEGEFHLSLGREYSCLDTWTNRLWAVFALGFSHQGSPWLRGDLALEKNLSNHYFRASIDTLWGLGKRQWHPADFHGYGAIRHQSIDLKVAYRYSYFTLAYAYRPYAKNFPAHLSFYSLLFSYPLGI